jgi:predicted flap endonuclease-1-like 5' DNA nuclease
VAARDAQIAELEASLKNCEIRVRDLKADLSTNEDSAHTPTADQDFDGDGIIEGTDEGSKPVTLNTAREGGADDLKMIKGIGPKLEQLCHSLGFFHFDQIAAWTDQEVAWVDANLEGFKGRVSRDNWVDQAKTLAAGGTTEFANRVKGGGVYE